MVLRVSGRPPVCVNGLLLHRGDSHCSRAQESLLSGLELWIQSCFGDEIDIDDGVRVRVFTQCHPKRYKFRTFLIVHYHMKLEISEYMYTYGIKIRTLLKKNLTSFISNARKNYASTRNPLSKAASCLSRSGGRFSRKIRKIFILFSKRCT